MSQKLQTVIVLDFGGQYKDLIARRVRESNVYSIILRGDTPAKVLEKYEPICLILTGGPQSVYENKGITCDPAIFEMGVPVLGICFGMQLMCHILGGEVVSSEKSEYGVTSLQATGESIFFKYFSGIQQVLMSHTDRVKALPEGFSVSASTADCPIAAMECASKRLFAVQFHPEVSHTENGTGMLSRFLYDICGAVGDYSMEGFIETAARDIKEKVGEKRVLLGLSGGVDSSVVAALFAKAIPGQAVCVFVDHGFMRLGEPEEIREAFKDRDVDLVCVDASERFLSRLAGVVDPEEKRKIIGDEFLKVFEEKARELGKIEFFAQGTIYPDVIESGTDDAATIKSHHNVGGLPSKIDFEGIIEPLRGLFKDEVREVGRQLGLPKELSERQPFPGPGLAVRIIGDLTREKCDLLRKADAIMREEIDKLEIRPSQYFAVLTGIRSVGVMGDFRTYDYTCALRAVTTDDFMTAGVFRIPYETLETISARFANEIKGINRIVYDITPKPPATIEWE